MNSRDKQSVQILFSRAHGERLTIAEGKEKGDFSALYRMLIDAGYAIEHTDKYFLSEQLANCHVVVIGAPEVDLQQEEKEILEQFVREGGAVLVMVDSGTTMRSLPVLQEMLAEVIDLTLHEYHNYPPTYLQEFWPHYITAGVNKVQIDKVAFFEVGEFAIPLARTRTTRQVIMACATVGQGRVVAVGDLAWLTDDLLTLFDNEKLATNVFRWLTGYNLIDIGRLEISETVKWGDAATVILQLHSNETEARPQIECVLESDVDALIDEPVRKHRSIPPGQATQMQWTVRPQILGNQKLRLIVHIEEGESLFFDVLPEMCCLAPGYLTLEIKHEGKRRTSFQTKEHFTAEGVFHWDGEEQQPYHLELKGSDGLLTRGYEEGHSITRSHLQAIASGQHQITLRLAETNQSLTALITVKPSDKDRLKEIKAAYLYPLDAEIAERLGQIDAGLTHESILKQPFRFVPPEEFLKNTYAERDIPWLQGVLAAIRREQHQNFALLDLFLVHFAPTYLPHRGTFIPYDPTLASRLIRLHPTDRRYMEYNLLQSEESEDITIKQNVAAYLLHEKYGHGFFFTQTRLGRQLSLLMRPEFYDESGGQAKDYQDIARQIKHSAIIINEGFAAWMELTFMGKLDRDIRQAVYPRRVLLIDEAASLRDLRSDFFQEFPPKHASPYRAGFEYLDFIGKKLDLRCAVRSFLIATNIEFGIKEDVQGHLEFQLTPVEIRGRLFDARPDWRGCDRLRLIAELLYKNIKEVQGCLKDRHCSTDCGQGDCPLEIFVEEELDWRM